MLRAALLRRGQRQIDLGELALPAPVVTKIAENGAPTLDRPERSFGRVRLWGTVGWMSAGWLLTFWLRVLKPAWFAAGDGTGLAACFWVGALFALTPIVLVSAVLAISWHLRRKRRKSGDAAVPS